VVRREQIYGFDVSSVFPGIQKALTPFDNPQIEYALILKELEMNSRQKAVQKSNLLKSRLPLATTVIIALCVMIYGAVNLLAEAHGDQIACAVAMGAYYKAFVVLGGEYWRFLTSGFVHSDVFHLLMNMIALYNMGRFCEEVFGAKKMLLILLTSVISGCALMHLTNPNIVGMGMSGGIYGLMGAFLVYAGSRGVFRQRAFQVRLSNIIFVNMMLNFMPGVAAAAHLGGLCCGLLWGLIFCDLKMESVRKHTAACLVALALFLGYKTIQVKEVDPIYPGTDMKTAEIYKAIGLETYAENLLNMTFKYYVQIEEDAQ
ncbi:MAG: rhomboid family intramembrane serine protease, partial [Erysipelotrichaceae bacterium]|nr:rhomboid family intramembrane serine protease [Erysipelotrichaceae bacterium]